MQLLALLNMIRINALAQQAIKSTMEKGYLRTTNFWIQLKGTLQRPQISLA